MAYKFNYNISKKELKSKDKFKEMDVLWREGYTYPIDDIINSLKVSKAWVNNVLLKDINYVVYSPSYIYQKSRRRCLSYIKKCDLVEWIMDNATFEVQTEYVDLYTYLSKYRAVCDKAYSMYKNRFATDGREFKRRAIPPDVLDYINDMLVIYNAKENASYEARNGYKWIPVEPFNIFEHEFYTKKDPEYKNISGETFYRRIFIAGDIKVKLSNTISIFVKSNQNTKNFKMPFLIPYGKVILVSGVKKKRKS